MAKINNIKAWQKFLKFHSLIINEIESRLKKNNMISLAWYDILIELETSPNKKLLQKELVEACILTKSGISRTLDTLEKNNLIVREVSQNDKRSQYAVITKKGSQSLKRAWPVYRDSLLEYFNMPIKDSTNLEKILQDLILKIK